MLKKTINLYKQIINIKLRFDLPIKKKIILFDNSHSEILKKIINDSFNILKVRDDKEIYFWIFIKQVIFFDFSFKTYCKNYIKFISPKILITFIDTNVDFYELKNSFDNINFISIQNGTRTQDWFKSKRVHSSQNLKCDYLFVFNKFLIKEYSKYIRSNYHILGNFKNNLIQFNKTKYKNSFLLISEINFRKNGEMILSFERKLMIYIHMFLSNVNKKINILLKNKGSLYQKKEINFYKKIFKSNCVFHKSLSWEQSYKTIDKFENIIFMYSTLGYESIVRKKKIAVFAPKKVEGFKHYFGWPATYKKSYEFFSSKKISYNEIKRVLNNINECSQLAWQNKYYIVVKDQFFFDKDNSKLKKTISKLL